MYFVLGLAALICFLAITVDGVTVTTPQGPVHGLENYVPDYGSVQIFLGIPYAAPPVGSLRLEPPQAPPQFRALNATQYAASCIQDPNFKLGNFYVEDKNYSEDCLYLNIFAPAGANGSLPVMVWIHGGGFKVGSSSQYDARRLAAIGNTVVITINYRLGLLGFFPNGKTQSTLGIQDMIMSLKWVKEWIMYFGGDPGKVTIFGESAGGVAVNLLATSPPARGLFKRAICLSGVSRIPWNTAENKLMGQVNEKFQELGCSDTELECMKKASVEDIIEVMTSVSGRTKPEVDNEVVLSNYADMGTAHDGVEFLIGINKNDDGLSVYLKCSAGDTKQCSLDDGIYPDDVSKPALSKDQAEILIEAYEDWYPSVPAMSGNMNLKAASRLGTDYMYRIPTNTTASDLVQKGHKVYVYEFNINGRYQLVPGPEWMREASHGDVVPFVFAWKTGVESEEEARAAVQVVKVWANFAWTGNPGSSWLPFTNERAESMMIDLQSPSGRLQHSFIPEEVNDFWLHYKRQGLFPQKVIMPPPCTYLFCSAPKACYHAMLIIFVVACVQFLMAEH